MTERNDKKLTNCIDEGKDETKSKNVKRTKQLRKPRHSWQIGQYEFKDCIDKMWIQPRSNRRKLFYYSLIQRTRSENPSKPFHKTNADDMRCRQYKVLPCKDTIFFFTSYYQTVFCKLWCFISPTITPHCFLTCYESSFKTFLHIRRLQVMVLINFRYCFHTS